MRALGRPAVLVLAASIAVGAGVAGWAFLGRARSPATDAEPAGDSPAGTALEDPTRAGLAVALRGPARPEAPAAPDGPLSLTEAHLGLEAGSWDVRERTLVGLGTRGCASREIVADLEKIRTESRDAHEQLLATAAILRVEGSRRYLRELAELAVGGPRVGMDSAPSHAVLAFDPTTGEALMRALECSKLRDDASVALRPAYARVVAALLEGGPSATDAAIDALEGAPAAVGMGWAYVLSGIRPLPLRAARLFAKRLDSGTQADRTSIEAALASEGADWKAVADEIVPALMRAMPRDVGAGTQFWLMAISRAGRLEPSDAVRIVEYGMRGPDWAPAALWALEELGAGAAGAASTLVAAAPGFGDGERTRVSRVLAGMRADAASSYALERLRQGTKEERAVWMAASPDLPFGRDLVGAFAALATGEDEREARSALDAIARVDPRLDSREGRAAIGRAMSDPRGYRRYLGVSVLQHMTEQKQPIPVDLVALLVERTVDEHRPARDAARWTMLWLQAKGPANAARRDGLLRIVEDPLPEPSDADWRSHALRALADQTPIDPRARAAAIRLLGDSGRGFPGAATLLLARVPDPTPNEWLLVSARAGEKLADSILATPAWKAVGESLRGRGTTPAGR